MNIEFERGDIVVLASVHNPSILTEKWLRENNLIQEKTKQSLSSFDFSLFETESFSLIVNPERLQITSKKDSKESLINLVKIGIGYVKLSPYITYKALGLNFIFFSKYSNNENRPKIEIKIDSINDIHSVFTNSVLDPGGIIYSKTNDYLLKLVIDPIDRNTLTFNFNHHYVVEGKDITMITQYLGQFVDLHENSRKIVEKLSKGELEHD